jgi:hypothetical protein
MSYTKATNFAIKDTLPTGDPNKIIRGADIDAEFNALQTATALLAPKANPTFTGTVTGSAATFTGDVAVADKIVHSGDTNTAIRFPAADTVSIETDGTERVRVSSAGVGIGTTSPTATLHVAGTAIASTSLTTPVVTSGGNLELEATGVGAVYLQTNSTNRVVVTDTGNVGVGTDTPSQRLHVVGTGLFSTSVSAPTVTNAGTLVVSATGASDIAFRTNDVERARFSSTGRLRIGGSGSVSADVHAFNTDTQFALQSTAAAGRIARIGSGDNTVDGFVGATTNHGFSIITNNLRRIDVGNTGTVTLTAYGAGTLSTNGSGVIAASDGTMKTKLATPVPGLDAVNALAPTFYRWNDDSPFASDEEELGFIAQEVGSVIPAASPELQDGQIYRNYHDRAIIAVLVKAVQELSQRVTELEAAL